MTDCDQSNGAAGNGKPPIHPGQVNVLNIQRVVPAVPDARWSCTNCGRHTFQCDLFWVLLEAHHSQVPLAFPLCERCARPFAESR